MLDWVQRRNIHAAPRHVNRRSLSRKPWKGLSLQYVVLVRLNVLTTYLSDHNSGLASQTRNVSLISDGEWQLIQELGLDARETLDLLTQ